MRYRIAAALAVVVLCLSLVPAIPCSPVTLADASSVPTLTLHALVTVTQQPNTRGVGLQTGDELVQFTRPDLTVGTNPTSFFHTVFLGSGPVSGDLVGTLSIEGNQLFSWWDELPSGTARGYGVTVVGFDDGHGSTFEGIGVTDNEMSGDNTEHSSVGYFVSTSGTGQFAGHVLIGTVFGTAALGDPQVTPITMTLRDYCGAGVSGPAGLSVVGTSNEGTARGLGASSGPQALDEFLQASRPNINIPKGDPVSYYAGGQASGTASGALNGAFSFPLNSVAIPGTTPTHQGWNVGSFEYNDPGGSMQGVQVHDDFGLAPSGNYEGHSYFWTTQTTGVYAGKEYLMTGTTSATGPAYSFGGNMYTLQPYQGTLVSVSPSSQMVHEGQTFTVDVAVSPGAAIAGAQCNLAFDPSLLVANGATEGNLLKQSGYTTFFSPGSVDNVNGTISNMYGAIMAQGGTVSTPGTFATVSFTAKTASGVSPIDLYGVLVGDAAGHPVPSTATDGNVQIRLCPDWDVNRDGCINILDIILVGQHFGETGTPCWIPEDVNCDGVISVLDIILIGQHFGEDCGGYTVGALFSTTGFNSSIGVRELQTVEMLIDQINDAGGINGHALELRFYDTASDPQKCLTLAQRLVEVDGVAALIGPSGTGESIAIVQYMNSAATSMVSCAAGNQIVEPANERHWVFKTPPNESIAVRELIEYLGTQHVARVALLTDTSGFGTAGRNALLAELAAEGIVVVADQTFGCSDANVYTQLAVIDSTDAQALIVWACLAGTAAAARNVKDMYMTIPLLASYSVGSKEFIDLAGDSANGVVFPCGRLLVAEQLPQADPQKALLLKYKQDFESAYGEGTASAYGGHARDALMMVVRALRNVGPDRTVLRDFIENNIRNWPAAGGIFNMSAEDHSGLTDGCVVTVKIVDGAWRWVP